MDDDLVLDLPILTDLVQATRGLPPHLNWDYPLVMHLDTVLTGHVDGVMGWHVWDDRIVHVNLLFADGHVELHPADEAKTRHPGYYQNLY